MAISLLQMFYTCKSIYHLFVSEEHNYGRTIYCSVFFFLFFIITYTTNTKVAI